MRNTEPRLGYRPTRGERTIIKAHGLNSQGVWQEDRSSGQLQLVRANDYWTAPPITITPVTGACLQALYRYWRGE